MTSPDKRSGEAGFTLIELLIALSIAGLMIALVVMQGRPRSAGLEENGTAAELAGALREARAQAIASNKPVALTVDVTNRQWQVDNQPAHFMPKQFRLSVLTVQGATRGDHAAILFEADGSSTGGEVEINDGLRKVSVNVDWLTGMVRVSEKHERP